MAHFVHPPTPHPLQDDQSDCYKAGFEHTYVSARLAACVFACVFVTQARVATCSHIHHVWKCGVSAENLNSPKLSKQAELQGWLQPHTP